MLEFVDVLGVVTPSSHNGYGLLQGEETVIDVPLGTSIARWNAHNDKREFCKQAHDESVSALTRHLSGDVTITGSYSGDLCLWDHDFTKRLCHKSFPGHVITQVDCCLSDPSLMLSVDRPREQFQISGRSPQASLVAHPATLRAWRIVQDPVSGDVSLTQLWALNMRLIWARFLGSNIVAIQERPAQPHEANLEQIRGFSILTEAAVYSAGGGDLLNTADLCGPNVTSVVASQNYLVLGRFDGSVSVRDASSLDELWCHDGTKGGRVRCVAIDHSETSIAYPVSGGLIVLVDPKTGKVQYRVDTDAGGNICMLAFSSSDRQLWVCNEYSLMFHPLYDRMNSEGETSEPAPTGILSRLRRRQLTSSTRVGKGQEVRRVVRTELSNCGVDIHPAGHSVVTGDLGANVRIYPLHDSAVNSNRSVKAPTSIRSVAWHPDGESVIYGCFDGSVWRWRCHTNQRPKKLFQLDGAVTCLRWRADYLLLGVGTITGKLAIYSDPGSSVVHSHQAHAPNMEVWSLQWSPCGTQIVTSSEDRTSVVWDIGFESDTQVKVAHHSTLEGHQAAVTCADWKATASLGPVLITSSDDRTLRVYRTDSWELHHVFQTDHLYVTYCALEPDGSRFICVTEDGYRYVFCLENKVELDRRKVHNGSIEGLAWHGPTGIVGCCSSDCTVSVSSIQAAVKS